MEKTYITKAGLEKLKKELEFLQGPKRKEIASQLELARSYGDLRENAEYDAAKHALALNEIRINEIAEKLSRCEIISLDDIPTDKVFLGAIVTVKDLKYDEDEKYTLVSSDEVDAAQGKISIDSPVAKALLGKVVGDVVEIQVPRGTLKLEVIKIER